MMFIKKLLLPVCLLLYIVGFLFSYDYVWDNLFNPETIFDAIRNILEYAVMFISFMFLASILWKNKITRIFSIFFLFLLSSNFFISICCRLIYHSGFNIGMAVSVLDTNYKEALSMSKEFIFPISIATIFFILLLVTTNKLAQIPLKRTFILISSICILLPIAFKLKHLFISNRGGGSMIKNVFYHYSDFVGASNMQEELMEIQNNKVNYHLKKEKEGVDNIVLLIGESVRKQNMSLYGYERKTTPEEDKELENMLIFEDAVSPAAITNTSVPLVLSSIQPEDFKVKLAGLSDNIVNLANHSGYKTYWYSTQGGARGITAIATYAQNKKWVNGYDEDLIPFFKSAIKEEGKKLIILHINGSHPNACDKYPKDQSFFGTLTYTDCYDNSIKYTDKIIGEMFKIMKERPTIFIYLSDHGQKKDNEKYIHADTKEATSVPLYVWYSSLVSPEFKRKERIQQKTQTTIIYPLIAEYIGLEKMGNYKNESLKYMKLDYSVIDYQYLEN